MKDIILVHKKIIYDKSEVLLKSIPDENWQNDWRVMAGEWKYENGYLVGKECGNKGGILFSKNRYDDNVMLCFTASTVAPATRDVNAVFCAEWDNELNDLGDSYVCGVNGWYNDKAGIERNEKGGKLTFRSLTASYKYRPGEEIRMVCGAIDGHCFMAVNDELVSEYIEYKNYLKGGHVGFSPFCTILRIKDIEIRKIYFEEKKQFYVPEF